MLIQCAWRGNDNAGREGNRGRHSALVHRNNYSSGLLAVLQPTTDKPCNGAQCGKRSHVVGLCRRNDGALPRRRQWLLPDSHGRLFELILGLLGLTLAIVGVYGVVSYAASQRTHER